MIRCIDWPSILITTNTSGIVILPEVGKSDFSFGDCVPIGNRFSRQSWTIRFIEKQHRALIDLRILIKDIVSLSSGYGPSLTDTARCIKDIIQLCSLLCDGCCCTSGPVPSYEVCD